MAQKDLGKLADGFRNFLGGVHSLLNPNLLAVNQVSWAVNVSLRGGYADSRPGANKRSILFDNIEIQDWVESHAVRGYGVYEQPSTGARKVLFSCGGRIFLLSVDNYEVREITPKASTTVLTQFTSVAPGDEQVIVVSDGTNVFPGYPIKIGTGWFKVTARQNRDLTVTNLTMVGGVNVAADSPVWYLSPNSQDPERVYFQQAEQYMIVQNGLDRAIIYDGQLSRRSNEADKEVPTGTVMAYSQGRLWVAVSAYTFVAGDIAGGPTGVLKFTENQRIAGGGAFRVPSSKGKIAAMHVMPNLDATLGQGPLQVMTKTQVCSVNAPSQRDQWQSVTDPIQTVSLLDSGALDQYGVAVVNGDIFFRSTDGVRSFIMARRDFGTWAQTPISVEMSKVIESEDESMLPQVSMAVFDNRLLVAMSPMRDHEKGATYFRGLGALNFDAVSAMGQKSPPVWEGLWTGFNPYMIFADKFENKQRCFMFCRNPSSGSTELWELSRDDCFDNETGRIESALETPAMIFGSPYEMKRLDQAELWIDRVAGTVNLTMRYRPDQYPCWIDWPEDKEVCIQARDCSQETVDCLLFRNFREGYKTRLRWGQPPETDETFDNKPARYCYEVQLRIEWIGKARIKAGIVKAQRIEEEPHAGDL